VCDARPAAECAAAARELEDLGVEAVWGQDGPELLEGRDLVVWSPGIPVSHPLARAARAAGIPLLSELEIGWRASRAPFVCITGTNGKSTTTDLTGALARATGRPVEVCGNIGRPVCDAAPKLPADGIVVAEVSSFQLETVDALEPFVAVWLNLTPDHLDRHGDLATYAAMKRRLFEHLDGSDVAVWNADDPEVMKRRIPAGTPAAPQSLTFSVRGPVERGAFCEAGRVALAGDGGGRALMPVTELRLRGRHNVANVLAALTSVMPFDVPDAAMRDVLRSYAGLEHRLEPVGAVEGVEFVNDSKATNVQSLEVALDSFDRPVVLIAGGRDKGQDFSPLAPQVRRSVAHLVLIGEGTDRIDAAWPGPPRTRSRTLAEAVEVGFERARALGAPVLFSPGCASFDMFQDYEDRGRRFKAEVERLRHLEARA
jgi:UDP-N-acetylmuramoylalanine--D-glutamate ligase